MHSKAVHLTAGCERPGIAPAAVSAAGILGFAALTAVLAQVRVPLPHTPVPMTLQTLAVLLAGVALGPWRGAASQLLYLAAGALSVPVFAGGHGGIAHLWAATGGYLAAFVPAAAVAGLITHRLRHLRWSPAVAAAAGSVIIFAGGIAWLWWLQGDLGAAVRFGLLPFWVGGLLKWALASGIGVAGRRFRRA